MKNKWILFIAVLFLLAIFILLIFLAKDENDKFIYSSTIGIDGKYKTVIIDAGHGEQDGGAVAADGTIEKHINLSISKKLETYLRVMGYNVIMTRTEDKLLYDSSIAKTMRQRKVSDIHNRADLINSVPDSVLISIHQNEYPAKSVRGTQVFYSHNGEESKILAQSIQSAVKELLQPNNRKPIKKSGTNIYLLYYAENPAVMVECGFLSNYDECQKLKNNEYQNKMAFCIMCGILDYM